MRSITTEAMNHTEWEFIAHEECLRLAVAQGVEKEFEWHKAPLREFIDPGRKCIFCKRNIEFKAPDLRPHEALLIEKHSKKKAKRE